MNKKINISFFTTFWIIFLEMIYRIFIFKEFLNINTIIIMVFSLFWISIFNMLLNLFNVKINRILNIVFVLVLTIVTLAQIVYYNFYDSIFSFYSLTTGTGQVMHFWQMIIEVILRIWYVFALIIIPLILYLVFNNKLFSYNKLNKRRLIINSLAFILSIASIFLIIKYEKDGIYSTKRLMFDTHAPLLTVNKVGLNSMQVIDIYRYVFGFEESVYIEKIVEKEEEKVLEYNVYDINFEELIAKTKNKTIKKMHTYFSNVTPTEKNEYTGMFKNKNLIFITAEAFDTIAVDENITPTLYKMANNSFVFTNFYQPLYPVSTSDGEYMNLTSLIPKEGVWSFSKTSSISMPLGIGRMFKKNGYISYAFHNYDYDFYDRNESHKNLGFKYIGCGNGLEKKMNCSHWPNSDKEMINATKDYYMISDKPFLTYFMTVSGHLNYNFYGNNMASRNKKKVKNLEYSEAIKAYYATQIEFDKSMEALLKYLEENNKLSDTLIIISPDHYPYGLTKKQMNEVSTINRKNKFENYHTSLIMYNPNIEKKVIDKSVSGLDLLPTIYNLYGIDFDSRLLMGRDIFSSAEGLVILSDRSWITNKGKYNSVNKKFVKTTSEEIDDDYVDRINTIVYQRFSMSSLILENNYYKKLGL